MLRNEIKRLKIEKKKFENLKKKKKILKLDTYRRITQIIKKQHMQYKAHIF